MAPSSRLKAALYGYWQALAPSVAECRNRRAQVMMLRDYSGAETAQRAAYL